MAKIDRPAPGVLTRIDCRACGQPRALDDYRIFATKTEPDAEGKSVTDITYMDFCVVCEKAQGTITLYRRYNAYGTPAIVAAVFAAAKVPAAHRGSDQVRLLVEPKAVKEPETNEQLLAREYARREMAKRRLIYFTTMMNTAYQPGWVHQDICRRLEVFIKKIELGLSPRLMIFMPPRAGKSMLASDMFPSWVLGQHPEWGIIASSYAQSLPLEFSRNVRDRLEDPDYKAIFPDTKLRSDAKGIEAWKTTKGGGYIAAGVGTGITGKGFHLGIVDDPLKDDEAAQSEQIRDTTFKWYQSVFRTRAAPGAGILFINTRWHFDDPSGRLLDADAELAKLGVPDYERENWDVVSYAAIAETDEHLMLDGTIMQGELQPDDRVLRTLRRKGEALHPERYSLGDLKKIRNTFSTSMWNAMYQQAPSPEDGDFFKRDDFRYRWLDPAYRSLCRIYVCTDYAIGKKQRNDFTVAGAFALDANDDLYLLEVRRGRWGTVEIADNVAALVVAHKAELYAGEQGAIHMAVWPEIERRLAESRTYVSVDETLVPIQDKEVRARPLQGRVQRHKLFFSYDAGERPAIYDTTEKELLQFPNGVNDDIVDMIAWGARLALNISLPNAQKVPDRQKSWKDKLTTAATTAANHMAA